MNRPLRHVLVTAALMCIILVLSRYSGTGQAQSTNTPFIIGFIQDRQFQPVEEAIVTLNAPDDEQLTTTVSQEDGSFTLPLTQPQTEGSAGNNQAQVPIDISSYDSLVVRVQRPHFEVSEIPLDQQQMLQLRNGETLVLPDTTLLRVINAAFWIASAIFVGVLVLIATGRLHNTLAALLGVALIFFISYLGGSFNENLFIFGFDRSLRYIDWNVIFLIMGMMIVIAVVENTGIFQWLAFTAYRISGGRLLLLLPVLMLITGVASAFLDNVTTMLLMTPISVQIALSMELNPLLLLIPEVLASNVVGISTLIGTPTNILIGSFANISFNDFLINLTPGVLLALLGLILYIFYSYRKQISNAGEVSPDLLELLAERALDQDTAFVLISVDPRRDTPQRLAEYVRFFNPEFRAATGTAQALDKLSRPLGVYYAVPENPPDPDNYLV
ncbi:MAG: SLC13 family permease, partial [Anaerolineales bacterium]